MSEKVGVKERSNILRHQKFNMRPSKQSKGKTFFFVNMHIHFLICFVIILVQKNRLNYYLSTKPGNNNFNTTTNVL